MYFKTPIYVGLAGTALITSQAPLLVKTEGTINNRSGFDSSDQSIVSIKKLENINSYESEADNSGITPASIGTDYKDKEHVSSIGGVYITSTNTSQKFYLHKFHKPLNDFSLGFFATEEDYESIKKSDIKIELLKTAAWNSNEYSDEYESQEQNKIEELFVDLNETKTKQLLLSLSIRREWEKISKNEFSAKIWSKFDLLEPESIEDLKKLRIKYFKDFNSLKEYVTKKVKSCTGEKKACVASSRELGIFEQDKLSFFEESKKQ